MQVGYDCIIKQGEIESRTRQIAAQLQQGIESISGP